MHNHPVLTQEAKPLGTTKHIASIDGVRGFAIFCVVMFHGWGMGVPYITPLTDRNDIGRIVGCILSTGYSGVELFFVLSGFCLAYPFFSRPDRKDDWGRYFINRVRRIYPPYVIAFLLFSLISRVLIRLKIEPFVMANFLYEPFDVTQWLKALTLTQESSIIGSYWTLPLEWRWYFVFPIVLILSRKVSSWIVLLLTIGASYIAQTYGDRSQFYGSFVSVIGFLPLFTLGVVAASVTSRHTQFGKERLSRLELCVVDFAPIGLLVGLLISFCAPPSGKNALPLQLSMYWGLLFFSLILCAVHHPFVRRVFSLRPVIFLGIISYSVYLVQEPVIRGLMLLSYGRPHGDLRVTLTNFVLAPILCVIVGWIFHVFAERPFMKSGVKPAETSSSKQQHLAPQA